LRVLCVLALVAAAVPAPALAAPANDNFGSATLVGALPYTDSVDVGSATTESGEPQACSSSPRTVWYRVTPAATATLRADMAGSGLSDTNLRVYQAVSPGIGGLNLVPNGCVTFGGAVTFSAQAGVTYYLQAGTVFSTIGTSRVNIQTLPAPGNDTFAAATQINGLPFTSTVDTGGAGTEPGEPAPNCTPGTPSNTVWYAFKPAATGSISANVFNASFSTAIAAYTGTAVSGLTQVACRSFSGPMTFRATAGTTYYFQVGSLFGGAGQLQFSLAVAPAPVATMAVFPPDPSIFDTIQFSDHSHDPGGVAIETRTWDFGDGATASGPGCCPTHRYAQDRDYTAKLTITTADGRSASTSQVVRVKTHDVAITKLEVPAAGRVGRSSQLSVGVTSKRYAEPVQVQLYKSVPGSSEPFQLVGTLTQTVPMSAAGRATTFAFSYVFTAEDSSLGKVTFKAVATISDARDALPADNEALATTSRIGPVLPR
jgi:hypothetical protein